MWPRNDGTFVSPTGQKIPQQGGVPVQLTAEDIARIQSYAAASFHAAHAANGTYDPDDLDELDVTDSEFDDESDFDEEESDPENEAAIINAHFQQNPQNVYSPSSFNMPSVSTSEANNYNALSALSQFASVAPGFNMQTPNVSAANHTAVVNALSQMKVAAPNFNMQNQKTTDANQNPVSALAQQLSNASVAPNFPMQYPKVNDSNHNAVNVLGQHSAAVVHRQIQQQQQTQIHGNQPVRGYPNNGHQNMRDQNGNKNGASDDDNTRPAPQSNFKHSTPNRVTSRSCGQIRPRNFQIARREAGVDLFQLRRREFEETFITDESASSSPIKDITAKLKHLRLRRPSFLKIFQRNKHSTENLVAISTISPELRDSSIQAIQADEGKSQLQKISEVLLKPSESERNRSNSIVNPLSSYEKSIQAFLFRSNFPEHFLRIRLLKLNIEEVQQLIRQIDLLENVQDKLTETVQKESLSGAALMSCDLIELRKSLDLNLGHWTIFEQLITGLRHMQNDDFLKLNRKKPANIDGEKTENPEQTNQNTVPDDPSSRVSSSIGETQHPQPIEENKKEKAASDDAIA